MTDEPEIRLGPTSKWPDADIHYLILETDEFIVFLDSDLDIDWITLPSYDAEGPKSPAEHNDVLNRAASLECVPNQHQNRSIRLNFKRMVGEAVARSLDHDYDSAKKMLEQARLYMRVWGESAYFLVLAGVAGALGAVLSMIFRMGDTFPTSEAPMPLHILEAASRVFAGCFSGLLIAGSIKVGLVLPVFRNAGQTHLAMLIAGMVGGASERWAPSLIAKIESGSAGDQLKKRKVQ